MEIQNLKKRWLSLGLENGGCFQMDVFSDIYEKYSEPQRRYHTLEHIDSCLNLLDEVKNELKEPLVVEVALWFHDAIYNPKKSDNEEKSTLYAQELLVMLKAAPDFVEKVSQLIMATKHPHQPVAMEEKYIIDIDLSILGAPKVAYDQYAVRIRKEYSHVPAFLYRRERRKVLESFICKKALFNTEYFGSRYEHSARDNIEREIARLKSGYI